MKQIILITFLMICFGNDIFPAEITVQSYANVLNLRESPSTDGKIIIGIGKSSIIEVLSIDKDFQVIDGIKSKWYKVKVDRNKTGWIFGGFVKAKESAPYSIDEIIGNWDILGNDGIGEVSFLFKQHGKLEIRAIDKNDYSDDCFWIYNNIEDTIEIQFREEKWIKKLEFFRDNILTVAQNEIYRRIDVNGKSVEIKINRNNAGRLSFPFLGYNVNKDSRSAPK